MDKLNLGCGRTALEGFLNIDIDPGVMPDLVLDVTKGLPFKDSSIKHVLAYDFLEHVPAEKVISVMNDIHRVLEPGGVFEHFTPSTDGRGAFQDPTHVSFWNINSWYYYCPELLTDYKGFYDITARYKIQQLRDMITDKRNRVIHTFGFMTAIKD